MGLIVEVYRSRMPDCTADGISKHADSLCIVNVDGPFHPSPGVPAAMLVRGNGPGLVKIVPAIKLHPEDSEYRAEPRWCMMGGNYAATSDSRFHLKVRLITGSESWGAVAIHDRIEK
jgi:hypothetical protein